MAGHGFRTAGSLRVLVHRKVEVPLVDGSALVIQRAASERWQADTGVEVGLARTAVFLLLQRGRLRVGGDGAARYIDAGTVVAVAPGASYRWWVAPTHDAELLIWNVTGTRIEAFWQRIGGGGQLVVRPRRRIQLERCLEDLLDHLDAEDEVERRVALRYHAVALDLVALGEDRPADTNSAADGHAERCRDLIETRGLAIATAGDLAAALDLHPDYLARIYRARYGASPAEHLRRRRMVHACELLRDDEALATIAEILGFADAFSFSKAFKTWSGLSPKRWRQQFAGYG